MKMKISLVSLSFSLLIGCSSTHNGPVTDHFDGKKFFNPTGTQLKSFWSVLKWQWTRDRADWPENLEIPEAAPLEPITQDQAIAITFINHSTFLIRTKDFNIVTDPIWSMRSSPFQWVGPKRVYTPPIPFEKLPKIHFALISHNHYDHMDEDTLVRLQHDHKTRIIVPLGDKKVVKEFGINNAEELDWNQAIEVNSDLKFILTPAQHWSARGLFDRNESLWGSFIIIYKGRKIFFAGDTGYSDHFKKIHEQYGPMNLSLLPIGAFEPRWFMKDHHMNPAEAVQAHLDLRSTKSIGMHFGTFQLADEKYDQPQQELNRTLVEKKIPREQFETIEPGTTVHLF